VQWLSEFYGVTIRMRFEEHAPPHFLAEYGGTRAAISFDGQVLRGTLAPRALQLVREWTQLRRRELDANWALARRRRPLVPIAPLE
jgi:hypothetical protein